MNATEEAVEAAARALYDNWRVSYEATSASITPEPSWDALAPILKFKYREIALPAVQAAFATLPASVPIDRLEAEAEALDGLGGAVDGIAAAQGIRALIEEHTW